VDRLSGKGEERSAAMERLNSMCGGMSFSIGVMELGPEFKARHRLDDSLADMELPCG